MDIFLGESLHGAFLKVTLVRIFRIARQYVKLATGKVLGGHNSKIIRVSLSENGISAGPMVTFQSNRNVDSEEM